MSAARDFLRAELEREYSAWFGLPPRPFLDGVVEAWMADDTNSKHRFDTIEAALPSAKRILDMASGCGSAVFYGLLHGYDMVGIDPEGWKHTFNGMKAKERGYPAAWMSRFHDGVGEALPFPDDDFDCVTSYQTIEHVQDVDRVLAELVRVTRAGGGIHLRCPDYRGTFEGHYRLPWLPLFPRPLARAYLRAIGKPTAGLDTIQYITKGRVVRILRALEARRPGLRLRIVDLDQEAFASKRQRLPGEFSWWKAKRYARGLFREETSVNLFVYVEAKGTKGRP
ncbi:class I SAM-dependent methyltransferase [Polyangium mundeleinium]|uniref:Methyltransferase domain-containing protein n=1 Tax=Polyangium mundeleinium TaxID=2995306 RepID=A0ABT5ES53_9BACT|nr:methyltransferase domain-containing protein [Polyangium mundeleinium]MDC0743605.1 methyltransferase domain-containing protein [Polyangium mundeleinium]